MRLRQLDLWQFKGFDRFTVHFGQSAYLVGPNNAGKSTLVAATRAASGMLAHAQRRRPTTYRRHGIKQASCHLLPASDLGLVTENLRHQFRNQDTVLALKTDTDLVLTAVWPRDEEYEQDDPFFYVEHEDGRYYKEPGSVRSNSGLVGVIPGLSPLNHSERVLGEAYVRQEAQGRRTSQHARNQLLLIERSGELDDFKEFAGQWLPEVADISVTVSPSSEPGEQDIDVFIAEPGDPVPKELFWAGDGLQVFVQLLAHLWRLREAHVIVLDEPDLYLHADLQRRLVRLLNSTASQTITATHSPEMLAEAPSDTVIWVDRKRRRAVKRPAAATLEDMSTQIGSAFNLRLAAALRARVVVFVEGKDMAVLRALSASAGAARLAAETRCTVIELQGFSNWAQIEPFRWLVNDFLEGAVDVFAILDRDYHDNPEISEVSRRLSEIGVSAHVWRRKELESYLLVDSAIARRSSAPVGVVRAQLETITNSMTSRVLAQLGAARHDARRSSGRDLATTLEQAYDELLTDAADPEWRLARYPPKEILGSLNRWMQENGYRPVSAFALASELRPEEIADELVDTLVQINNAVPE